jgi:mitogen-activated protein kinase kinase
MRPTYGALLSHPWLASLSKPQVITEEDEDEDGTGEGMQLETSGTDDKEVADWVKNAMERKRNGLMGEAQKPALHAAPLDSVSPAATPGI